MPFCTKPISHLQLPLLPKEQRLKGKIEHPPVNTIWTCWMIIICILSYTSKETFIFISWWVKNLSLNVLYETKKSECEHFIHETWLFLYFYTIFTWINFFTNWWKIFWYIYIQFKTEYVHYIQLLLYVSIVVVNICHH